MMVAILYDDPDIVPEALYGALEAFAASGALSDAREAALELDERYPETEWAEKARVKLARWDQQQGIGGDTDPDMDTGVEGEQDDE
jgi:TolA-binding protein